MNLEDDANNRLISMTDAAGSTALGYTEHRGQTSGSVLCICRIDRDLRSLRSAIFAQVEVLRNDGPSRAIARGAQNSMEVRNKMKTSWCLLKLSLLFFTLWACPRIAHAYYDPGIQRWINRDPRREPGFESARRLHSRNATSVGERLEVSLFTFIGNDPLARTDPFGLLPLQFTLYGKYCGPGWCGNKKQSESDGAKQTDPLPEPADAMDSCCKEHDLCIGACKKPIRDCDKDMCDCLSQVDPADIDPPPGKDSNYIKNIWQAMIGVFCGGTVPGH